MIIKYFRIVLASTTFLLALNLGLLENFISLNDLLRENRVYYFKNNGEPSTGLVKTFWNNGYVENTGTLLNGIKVDRWEYFHDNGKLREKFIKIPIATKDKAKRKYETNRNFFGSFLNLIEVDFTPIISSSLIS